MKIGHFYETYESPAVTLQFLGNIRAGIEALREFLHALIDLRAADLLERKDLREIQELLSHENIRTTVRYTHLGYEQTRQTAEALSQALERRTSI